MKERIQFHNPGMKQYEKGKAPSLIPIIVGFVLLFLAAKFVYGATDQLPRVELRRHLAGGGEQTLSLECQREEDPAHFFCRLERATNGEVGATAQVDETTAKAALAKFFAVWPSAKAAPSTSKARLSLTWSITDGTRFAGGEARFLDDSQAERTRAVLALEGLLAPQLYR
jgi:hypothetical protein